MKVLTKSKKAYNDLMMDVTKKLRIEMESCMNYKLSTDMAMNIMELCGIRAPVEGTCGGMAMCQCYSLMMFHCQKWGR
jgi:hypothetical protein